MKFVKFNFKKDDGEIRFSLVIKEWAIREKADYYQFRANSLIKLWQKNLALRLKALRFAFKAVFYAPRIISEQSGAKHESVFLSWEKKLEKPKKSHALTKGIAATAFLLLAIQLTMMYLPVRANEQFCSSDVDVVMVMDVSGSMEDGAAPSQCEWWNLEWVEAEETNKWIRHTDYDVTEEWCAEKGEDKPASKNSQYTPSSQAKIDSAKSAAKNFVDNLGLNDQSALVSFSDNASLEKELSNDHESTKTSIDSLSPDGATNIGDAISKAVLELGSERANPRASKTIILLTDGKANRPEGQDANAYALEKAEEAANLGYRIFTIGLGDDGDIDEDVLEDIAETTGGKYHHAENGNDLSGIYDDIATRICELGSVSGYKYNDADGDGVIDNEDILSDWEIILEFNDATTSQMTDEQGFYMFAGLLPGQYRIYEIAQESWTQTYPENLFYEINLNEGDHITDINFGNYFPVFGCTDPEALNYDELVTEDNDSCEYEENEEPDEEPEPEPEPTPDPSDDEVNFGSLVINEIMQNPLVVIDNYGEWFEVYNASISPIDMQGCVISDMAVNYHTISSSLVVPAGGYVVLARNGDFGLNGSTTPDYIYTDTFLNNSSDQIILTCNDEEIDRVEYDGGPNFPDPEGASMILADPSLDNNIGSNWCVSNTQWDEGTDFGTPGMANVGECTGSQDGPGEDGEEPIYDPPTDEAGVGSITGYKYQDLDGATTTEDWNGLENWGINLFASSTELLATTTTNSLGYFEFIDLIPDEYTLTEDLINDWTQFSAPGTITVSANATSTVVFVNYYSTTTPEEPGPEPEPEPEQEFIQTGGGSNSFIPVPHIRPGSIFIAGLTETSAVVSWYTNYLATSRVVYGASSVIFDNNNPPNYGYPLSTEEFDTPANVNGVNQHTLVLTGLVPGTNYYFRVISHASPDIFSEEFTFQTSGVQVEETTVQAEQSGPASTESFGEAQLEQNEETNNNIIISDESEKTTETDEKGEEVNETESTGQEAALVFGFIPVKYAIPLFAFLFLLLIFFGIKGYKKLRI